MRLGDAGADVVKVEPPPGDPERDRTLPLIEGASARFLALNRNKRSLFLPLDAPANARWLEALAGASDVVVLDESCGSLQVSLERGRGLVSRFRAWNPALVVCWITGLGDLGPMSDQPAGELVAQAMAEYPSALGRAGESPVRLGADAATAATAFFSVHGILAALLERERSGAGQLVTTSLFGSLLHLRGIIWSSRSDPDEWYGFHLESYLKPPDHGYQTADRPIYFSLGRGSGEDWDRLLSELDLLDVLRDRRFDDFGREAVGIGRWAHEVKPLWEKGFAGRTAAEVIALVRSVHGNAAPLMNYADLEADPQVAHLQAFQQLPGGGAARFQAVHFPWRLSETPASIRLGVPVAGEHTAEILRDWSVKLPVQDASEGRPN